MTLQAKEAAASVVAGVTTASASVVSDLVTQKYQELLLQFLADFALPGACGLVGALCVHLYAPAPVPAVTNKRAASMILIASVVAAITSYAFSQLAAEYLHIAPIRAVTIVGLVAGVLMPRILAWIAADSANIFTNVLRAVLRLPPVDNKRHTSNNKSESKREEVGDE